jgi:hypothetical protein
MWKPEAVSCDEKQRTIWLWSHPSVYKQIENELIHIFNLETANLASTSSLATNDEANNDSPLSKKRKLTESSGPGPVEVNLQEREKTRFHSPCKNIELKCLKDKLIRFKLLGPLATTILGNVLKTIDEKDMKQPKLE